MDPPGPFNRGDEFLAPLSAAVELVEDAINRGESAFGNADLIAAFGEVSNALEMLRIAIGQPRDPNRDLYSSTKEPA